MKNKGILKTKKAYERADKITFIVALVSGVAMLATTVSLFVVQHKADKIVKDYMNTDEYKTAVVEQIDGLTYEFQDGQITIDEMNKKFNEITSTQNAQKILDNSNNDDTKIKQKEMKKNINGFLAATGTLGGLTAVTAAAEIAIIRQGKRKEYRGDFDEKDEEKEN